MEGEQARRTGNVHIYLPYRVHLDHSAEAPEPSEGFTLVRAKMLKRQLAAPSTMVQSRRAPGFDRDGGSRFLLDLSLVS